MEPGRRVSLQYRQRSPLCPIGYEKLAVAGEVVGPVAGNAELAFPAQTALEPLDQSIAACSALVGEFFRPECEQPRQAAAALIAR